MRKILLLSKAVMLVCLLFGFSVFSQVGIGTITPEASSMLDVTSTTQGMLTPRMTTLQRTAIVSPADGLIVYDTSLKAFYYYNSSLLQWVIINNGASGRLKFKRIKSTDVLATVLADEKTAGGANYKLDTGTYYEINGTINFDAPIELNNAYLVGLDANEDKIIRSGNLFVGATGGTIKNLYINVTGSPVFNLSGANTENLIFRDCIVAGCTNVGSISGFGLVFFSVIQYVSNATGITYDNITRLLLSNTAWFGNNTGTFEKYTGTFTLMQKQGGFCEVNGSAIGVDVSSNPTISGDAVMESVVFTGSNTAGYVKPYSIANTYTGYNFSNAWNVRCAGIPTEGDPFATGFLYDSNNTAASRTVATTLNQGYKVVTNATATNNMFRVTSGTSGRLTYVGKKSRVFQVNASISFVESSAGNNTNYLFYIVKIGSNGTTVTALPATETFLDTNSGFVQAFPITGTVQLNTNESVEVYLKRITNPAVPKINIDVYSLNMAIK